MLGVLLVGASSPSIAQEPDLPLWEVGGGATFLRVPDYRGSEDVRNYVLPIPWFVYRGDIIRADRDGARARIFDSERVKVHLSVSGSVPVDSDRNLAREGMEDLSPLFELGPVSMFIYGAPMIDVLRSICAFRSERRSHSAMVCAMLATFSVR